jgi:hypothetical protein
VNNPTQHHHTSTDGVIRKMLAHEFVGTYDFRPLKKAGRRAKLRLCREIRRAEKQQWKRELLAELTA